MLSVEIDPPLGAGDVVQLAITLPDGAVVVVGGRVRWASSVLPGMVGVEFDPPMINRVASMALSSTGVTT